MQFDRQEFYRTRTCEYAFKEDILEMDDLTELQIYQECSVLE
jgi:hypothetical protein